MMLKFQLNALRRGDPVFVHDASEADLGLRAGVVALIDARPLGHDVGIRLTTGNHDRARRSTRTLRRPPRSRR